ncbi:MAG: PEP-CTERM sorting domain-containing protein [Alphaproteobacteria bacterium]|nr:MAG: PEP-CTERM sorting domain-containing protein [Alphaproteobacteria bacterium]
MNRTIATMLGMGLATLILVDSANATPSRPLYIDDDFGQIGLVDLGTRTVTVLGQSGVLFTDIAFNTAGDLYGTSFTSLYSINKTTGAATLVGDYGVTGASGINGLVGYGTGLLATSFTTNNVYAIDTAPFAITTLTGTSTGASAGDLAFAVTGGTLYGTLIDGNLAQLAISGSTVTATTVGNTGNGTVYGLATGDDGITYAVSGTQIYTVDLSTAVLTPLFDYAGQGLSNAYGTAFFGEAPVPTPEPATLALLGTGLLGLLGLRRANRT